MSLIPVAFRYSSTGRRPVAPRDAEFFCHQHLSRAVFHGGTGLTGGPLRAISPILGGIDEAQHEAAEYLCIFNALSFIREQIVYKQLSSCYVSLASIPE